MQVFDAETRVHRSNLKRARQRLAANPEDADAQHAVDEARSHLEWHQCLDIETGIYDHQADEF
jgi:hypothetical protein